MHRGTGAILLLLITLLLVTHGEPARLSREQRSSLALTTDFLPAGEAPSAVIRTEATMPVGHQLLGPARKFPVELANLPAARLRLVELSLEDLALAQRLLGYHRLGADPLLDLPKPLQLAARERWLSAIGPVLPTETLLVDVFADQTSDLVLAVLDAPGSEPRVALIQRGKLSLVTKYGATAGIAWVVSTETSKPVQGALVEIRHGRHRNFIGRTDAQGLLKLPARDLLLKDRQEPNDGYQPVVASVVNGSNVAYTTEHFQTGIEGWQFELPSAYYSGEEAEVGMVTAERGVYRPGEQVHLLGMLRHRLPNGRLKSPSGTLRVVVSDPDDAAIISETVALTDFGTFRLTAAVPPTARLGRYTVEAHAGSSILRHRFEVAEYKAVRFEVNTSIGVSVNSEGRFVNLRVAAQYLYGAPVKGGKVSYSVSAREAHSWTEGQGNFNFGSARYDGGYPMEVSSGELVLSDNGSAEIRLDAAALVQAQLAQAQRVDLIAEVTVHDLSMDSVSARSTTRLETVPILVGVKNENWVVSAKEGWPVTLRVTDAHERPLAGRMVELKLYRKFWASAAQAGNAGAYYVGNWQRQLVELRTLKSTGKDLPLKFELPQGGEYELDVAVVGQRALVRDNVWCVGTGSAGAWDNTPRIELHPDKAEYRPGDSAKVLVASPYEQALALFTVEREGVLSAEVRALSAALASFAVPITETQVPNVFAGVVLIPGGLARGGPATGVPLRVGYHELKVSPEGRKLRVQVTPRTRETKPGSLVPVEVRVSDQHGKPVRAEVTLWAADEGVLKLTGYKTPDPFQPVYAQRLHDVSLAANLTRWTQQTDFNDGSGGDAGTAASNGAALRSRFLATAFFSNAVVTNQQGLAKIQVPLPDNITRWRVMAAVADTGNRFGSGESSVIAKKPFQVSPVVPRFLVLGDRAELGVVLENLTQVSGAAEVSLSLVGAKLIGAGRQKLELAPGARQKVSFWAETELASPIEVRVSARFGQESDGYIASIPVKVPGQYQTQKLGEQALTSPLGVSVTIPPGVEPNTAELIVNVAPRAVAALGAGLDALFEYPHGCVEQTTSLLIPMVLLEGMLKEGDVRFQGAAHRERMTQAVFHVLQHQNDDGGFGLWPESDSEPYLTAFALWGLLTARDHGYFVSAPTVERGFAYLEEHTAASDSHGQFSVQETQVFIEFVKALNKRGSSERLDALAAGAKQLSEFGQALLASALALRGHVSQAWLARTLLLKRGPVANVREKIGAERNDYFDHGRDLRATAAVVTALIHSGHSKDAKPFVEGILAQRGSDGSWGITYNNLWALYAITSYEQALDAVRSPRSAALELAGKKLLDFNFDAKRRALRYRVPPEILTRAANGSYFAVIGQGADLHASVRLRYVLAPRAQHPVNRGFDVSRRFLDADSGQLLQSLRLGQMVRVRLKIVSQKPQHQVALTGFLPGGLEPIDTNFVTSVQSKSDGADSYYWSWRELHDERVSFFADYLPAGSHEAEFLARVTRAGTFIEKAPFAEAMYQPDVQGLGATQTHLIQ